MLSFQNSTVSIIKPKYLSKGRGLRQPTRGSVPPQAVSDKARLFIPTLFLYTLLSCVCVSTQLDSSRLSHRQQGRLQPHSAGGPEGAAPAASCLAGPRGWGPHQIQDLTPQDSGQGAHIAVRTKLPFSSTTHLYLTTSKQ